MAKTIFGKMTDDHFGFAEDFRIIDMSTGQARDVMTPSGGETFLASLALALVEALFFDEGSARSTRTC
ncbi:hypothetical protein OG205_01490 [Lentzea sp. NBC_00516]|uniref:hypothetical protein n=1 Tax=Lentzea sp. NBC_00516 TaxID=2903582 RepID=UPI002E824685|nr:hypothetical protein [Lentzea sp. NBC_00516]WUD25699.1 hypothetical protein OG205_01490 [Lentzea sp. NBC_00516]